MSLSHKIHRQRPSPSADTIAANDDLMTEILIRLPPKSLCRFKSLSKHWYSHISNTHFSLLRMPHSGYGFFFPISSRPSTPLYKYVHIARKPPRSTPIKSLTFGDDRLTIMHSCNGLFLCSSTKIPKINYYIYNPTTNQFANIPPPPPHILFEPLLFLAFDLSRAPHYKIVLVHCIIKLGYQIEIYSSKTGTWRSSGKPFPTDTHLDFGIGVFLNGTMHWPSTRSETSLRFDVDRECLETMPMPPIQGNSNFRTIGYFGESRGHLHLVCPRNSYSCRAKPFDVLEMESDYSNWFVKYHVDPSATTAIFSEINRWPPFTILHVFRGKEEEEEEEESYLVLYMAGMLVYYNLKHKTAKKICNLGLNDYNHCRLFDHQSNVYHYIENLHSLSLLDFAVC